VGVVDEALEALGILPGVLPEPRLLADLFVRFQAQVPLRRAPAGAKADALVSAWLEEGAGCCGEGRTGAFRHLAAAAGFPLESAAARGPRGDARTVLLARRGSLLLDPGFPLPAPLSLDPPAESAATGYGVLTVRPSAGGAELRLETRGDERLLYRVEPGGDAGGAAGPPTPPPQRPGLFRLLDDRLLRWEAGTLEVTDAWSRLRVPLPSADAEGLEALFGPPVALAAEEGAKGAPAPAPTLAVYHSVGEDPARLHRLLADPEAHAALLPGGWTVEGLEARNGGGFDRNLLEDGKLLRRERVTLLPDGAAVAADGPLALFPTRTWRLEPRPSGTRLRLLATLREPVPPRGLPEGVRRRLVFELASELLALDRLSAGA